MIYAIRILSTYVASCALMGQALAQPSQTLSFFPSSEPYFRSHDGGLYRSIWDIATLTDEQAKSAANEGVSLFYSLVNLGDFKRRPLSDSYLARLQQGFDRIRGAGFKLIVRFAYSNDGEGGDAPLPIVLRHIAQLGPVVSDNKDVISYFHAGFIGQWGEWHTSTYGLDDDQSKLVVKDALLDHFPIERQILFRYPSDVMRWFPSGRPSVSPSDYLQSNPNADKKPRQSMSSDERRRSDGRRIGIHNQCLLSSPTDAGTFRPPKGSPLAEEDIRQFTQRWNRFGIYGGEMCTFGPRRLSCEDILTEGRLYRLGFVNNGYQMPDFRARWQEEACEADALRSIGQRLELVTATLPLVAGRAFTVRLTLRNVGWSRFSNWRPFNFIFVEQKLGIQLEAATSIQAISLAPPHERAGDQTFEIPVKLDPNIPSGEYVIGFRSPDPSPTLERDPRYALRIANADGPEPGKLWDSATGTYWFGASIRIDN